MTLTTPVWIADFLIKEIRVEVSYNEGGEDLEKSIHNMCVMGIELYDMTLVLARTLDREIKVSKQGASLVFAPF